MMEHYTPTDSELTDNIGFCISRARHLIVSEMSVAVKHLDITSGQMGVLLLIRSGAGTAASELSKLLGVDSAAMTRLVDRLENKGLAKRTRSGVDRRVVNISLTTKGTAIATQIPEIVPKVLNTRLRNFTKIEVDELGRLLRKFTLDSTS